MADGVIHRCTKECPYNKKCFVCKTETEVSGNVVVLHKYNPPFCERHQCVMKQVGYPSLLILSSF